MCGYNFGIIKQTKGVVLLSKLRRADIISIFIIIALAIIIFAYFAKSPIGNATAIVRQNNEIVRKIALTGLRDKIEFTLIGKNGAENTIVAENGKIWFSSATCRHQTCVNTGKIGNAGQSAVCLENMVSITIDGLHAPDAVAK